MLDGPLPPPVWPNTVCLVPFSAEFAEATHALLRSAYAQGNGSVGSFAEWWQSLSTDGEYDPALCFLACDQNGKPVGLAQCWTSAFIKDLAVAPAWQHRGVGSALLSSAFQAFRDRGAACVDLKLQSDNISALRFYVRHGMFRATD
jgi:ribosomal protein S18 acetylase RimI-like enzyme